MRSSQKPIVLILTTLVTCLVAAAGLGATYAVTAPKIEAQIRKAEQDSLKSAMPEAEEFVRVEDADALKKAAAVADPARLDPTFGDGIFLAKDGSGQDVGLAVKLGSRGYGGFISMVVAMDRSGKVTGASVVTHNETAGLGSKVVVDPKFMGQFKTWTAETMEKDAKGLDAISGATKSSKGVERGVEASGRIFMEVGSQLLGGEGS